MPEIHIDTSSPMQTQEPNFLGVGLTTIVGDLSKSPPARAQLNP